MPSSTCGGETYRGVCGGGKGEQNKGKTAKGKDRRKKLFGWGSNMGGGTKKSQLIKAGNASKQEGNIHLPREGGGTG